MLLSKLLRSAVIHWLIWYSLLACENVSMVVVKPNLTWLNSISLAQEKNVLPCYWELRVVIRFVLAHKKCEQMCHFSVKLESHSMLAVLLSLNQYNQQGLKNSARAKGTLKVHRIPRVNTYYNWERNLCGFEVTSLFILKFNFFLFWWINEIKVIYRSIFALRFWICLLWLHM